MSNFVQLTFHPVKRLMQQATWVDDHFGHRQYGVFFPGDEKAYRPEECILPATVLDGDVAVVDAQAGGGFEYKASGPDDIGLLPAEAFGHGRRGKLI